MNKLSAIRIIALSIALPGAAYSVDIPSTADSGRLQQEFTKEKVEPKADKELIVKKQPTDLSLDKARLVKFKLDAINIEGNTVFKTDDLQAIYKDKLGKEISLADLYAIRDAITERYFDAGYILSKAVLPPQDFNKSGAKVKIKIVEGYVNKVSKQGDPGGNATLIDNYLQKMKQEGGPLNSKTLEKYVLLLNDLPGVTATATLKPAEQGKDDIDIIINLSHKSVQGLVSLDNSGTKYTGQKLLTGEVDFNSPLGLYDQLKIRGLGSNSLTELKFGDASYEIPISNEGTTLKFEYSKTHTHPGSSIKYLDIIGDSTDYKVELAQPVIRSRGENLSLRSSFELKTDNTDSLASELYDDKTRIITLGGTFDLSDRFGGINVVDLAVAQGIDAFGADDNKNSFHSRGNGQDVFTKFNAQIKRQQEIGWGFGVLLAAEGQYSFQPLYASEEFGIGGLDYGRGYDYSEITGDQGEASKIEFQYGDHLGYKYLSDYQIYTFVDQGIVWQRDKLFGEAARDSLISVGIGTRLSLVQNLSGYLQLAKPIDHDIAAQGDKDPRVNVGLTYTF